MGWILTHIQKHDYRQKIRGHHETCGVSIQVTNDYQVLTFVLTSRGGEAAQELHHSGPPCLCSQVPFRASWLVTHLLGDPEQSI